MATKPELTKLAQKAFNDYIRARDYGKPCISSGKPIAWGKGSTGGVADAGHYLSVGARPNLRFNEDNCHAQSKHDNRQLAGNAVNYRIGLINRIGIERVEALESDHELKHYTKDELREIAIKYRQMAKQSVAQYANPCDRAVGVEAVLTLAAEYARHGADLMVLQVIEYPDTPRANK